MNSVPLLILGAIGIASPISENSLACYSHVRSLRSPAGIDRLRAEIFLEQTPAAIWALAAGRHSDQPWVRIRCERIIDSYRAAVHMKCLLRATSGDFDRLINSFLAEPMNDGKLAAHHMLNLARLGRTLDRLAISQSRQRWDFPNQLTTLSVARTIESGDNPRMLSRESMEEICRGVFHSREAVGGDIAPSVRVVKRFDAFMAGTEESSLVRCELAVLRGNLARILLADGNVESTGLPSACLIVCGGDFVATENTFANSMRSIIVAAGDASFVGRAADVKSAVVISGGTIRVAGSTTATAFISPKRTIVERDAERRLVLFCDDKRKPIDDFFFFRDLWADYGIKAEMKAGHVEITDVKLGSVFSAHFRVGDSVLACEGMPVTSVGQFRRLVGRTIDDGRGNFQIARNGDRISVTAKSPSGS